MSNAKHSWSPIVLTSCLLLACSGDTTSSADAPRDHGAVDHAVGGHDAVAPGDTQAIDRAPAPTDGAAPSDALADLPGPPASAPPLTAGVQTLAGWWFKGKTDGMRYDARFYNPVNVVIGKSGELFVADYDNGLIREVNPMGKVSTITAPGALYRPFGLAVAPSGELYVQTDGDVGRSNFDGALWKVDPKSGKVTLLVDHSGLARGLALLPDGRLAMVLYDEHALQLFDPSSNVATPLAGVRGSAGYADGSGAAARFDTPYDVVVVDAAGTMIVADYGNNRLRRVTVGGVVTTYAGTGTAASNDGTLSTAAFYSPQALAIDSSGTIYVTDVGSYRLRRVSADGHVTTIAGDGVAGVIDDPDPLRARFFGLEGIDVTADGRVIYISDGDRGEGLPYHRVRRLALP